MSEQMARRLVAARAEGRCELCQQAVPLEWAHRRNRSHGGPWEAVNGLHLCGPCHRWTEENPTLAYAGGWRINTANVLIETVPVWLQPNFLSSWYVICADDRSSWYSMERTDDPPPRLPEHVPVFWTG